MMKKTIKGGSFSLKNYIETPKSAKDKALAYNGIKIGDFVRINGTQWDGAEGIVTHLETGDYSNSTDKRYRILVTTYTVDPDFSFVILDPRNCQKISKMTAKGRIAAKKMALDWRNMN